MVAITLSSITILASGRLAHGPWCLWDVSGHRNFAVVNSDALVMPMEGFARTLWRFITKSTFTGKFGFQLELVPDLVVLH